MDRLRRVLTHGTWVMMVGAVVAGSGCRSTRNEVPVGRPYATTGGTPPPLGFNNEPHPNSAVGGGLYPNGVTPGQSTQPGFTGQAAPPVLPSPDPMSSGLGSSPAQLGTPPPSSGLYGVPPGVGRNPPSMAPGIPGSDTGR